MAFNFFNEQRISAFIIANEKRYIQERKTTFVSLDEKKDWFFIELSKKFPQMRCITIRKKINKHYELVGNSYQI